jgi:hypothetical protein
MTTDSPATYTCAICGQVAPAPMTAECNWCDRRFHLNQRNDIEGKDCGEVWVDEQYLALQFACQDCLAGTARDPNKSLSAAVEPEATAGRRIRRYRKRT